MKYLVPAMLILLGACATDGQAPTVPTVPAPPVVDAQSCANINENIAKIEAAKKLSGHYGEGEEERLADLKLALMLMGCELVSAPAS